jgi:hypothetical protein
LTRHSLARGEGDIDGGGMLIWLVFHWRNHAMMYLDTPPRLIGTEVFSAIPERFRRKGGLK